MKWLIASDLHGSLTGWKRLKEAFEREKAERMLLLGDLFYHGPYAGPPEGYAPAALAGELNGMKEVLFSVRGNTDSEAVQQMLEFPVLAEYLLLPVGDRLVFATHGHIWREEHLPPLKAGDILLAGHTHIPACRTVGGILYLNPGSAALPLGGSEAGYMTLEDGVFRFKTMDGKETLAGSAEELFRKGNV